MTPRFLYLHGFASGPGSKKGVAFAEHYARRGVTVDQARKSLVAAKADTGPQLVTALPVAGVSGNQAAAGHWGETIKRFGG